MPTRSAPRLDVLKTYKLFINGAFPRSESGRALPIVSRNGSVFAHVSHASRKDLRDSVEAARGAIHKWSQATAYNRGQVLYRLAEMLEGKREEFISALASLPAPKKNAIDPKDEVAASIDRVVHTAGWCDKLGHVLGCHNPVAGPYYNFTIAQPTGAVCVLAPDAPALLGLIALVTPVIASGNTVVALASDTNPIPAAILGEALATSDLPPGVVNILTCKRDELLSDVAGHRDIDALLAAGLTNDQEEKLRAGTAENIKRVTIAPMKSAQEWLDAGAAPLTLIESFVEHKSIWHPSSSG